MNYKNGTQVAVLYKTNVGSDLYYNGEIVGTHGKKKYKVKFEGDDKLFRVVPINAIAHPSAVLQRNKNTIRGLQNVLKAYGNYY